MYVKKLRMKSRTAANIIDINEHYNSELSHTVSQQMSIVDIKHFLGFFFDLEFVEFKDMELGSLNL